MKKLLLSVIASIFVTLPLLGAVHASGSVFLVEDASFSESAAMSASDGIAVRVLPPSLDRDFDVTVLASEEVQFTQIGAERFALRSISGRPFSFAWHANATAIGSQIRRRAVSPGADAVLAYSDCNANAIADNASTQLVYPTGKIQLVFHRADGNLVLVLLLVDKNGDIFVPASAARRADDGSLLLDQQPINCINK